MTRLLTILLTLAIATATMACERDHPATPSVDRFVEAWTYGDVDGLLAVHIDATKSTDWCREEFRTALAKAREEIDSEECQRVRALTARDLDAMKDELRLAFQLTGWVCENPDGTCEDYAASLFRQSATDHPMIVDPPRKITVRKVFGDDQKAAAYVDVVDATGRDLHRTLELTKVGDRWRVAGGFLNPPEEKSEP